VPSWLDRGAELAGYPWATGAEMACCTLLQILPRYNKVPSWRPLIHIGYQISEPYSSFDLTNAKNNNFQQAISRNDLQFL
jgi:hypothetical protein